ncbi:MauE/DoxX family redox-associated membrane protein [Allokutzneria albata]|uniref:Methylamine utilisation protein MauE n=1 Tax=Allokutzneria albata TaxID=211114 RepID=A0A1G9RHC5_ALLAB|nr:MauE/DoxX family redox-associated membrane protein [Allokutzneria albata]SDM22729.1 Methylamine utilisation protein MauE [Allokutzneria albata]
MLLSSQVLVVAIVLAWTGGVKLLGPSPALAARRTALDRLVGKGRELAAYRAVGVVELLIATALALPPVEVAEGLAATALALGFVAYLLYARQVRPESDCGCMGGKGGPIGWRSLSRAGLLVLTSAMAAGAGPEPTSPVVVLAGLAVFVALSAELDRYWLLPLRRLRVRLSHPLAGLPSRVPLAAGVEQVERSPAYRAVAGLLRSDVRDTWIEGEWRFLSYSARHRDRAATVVFAVPTDRFAPEEVQAALVDESTEETLWRFAPTAGVGSA